MATVLCQKVTAGKDSYQPRLTPGGTGHVQYAEPYDKQPNGFTFTPHCCWHRQYLFIGLPAVMLPPLPFEKLKYGHGVTACPHALVCIDPVGSRHFHHTMTNGLPIRNRTALKQPEA